MPTAAEYAELAKSGLSYLLNGKTVKNATDTYTGGLDNARATIQGKSANLSALNRNIYDRNQATNRDVYGNQQATNAGTLAATNARLDPYAQAGGESLAALREGVRPGGGLADPYKGFTPEDLANDPGYQFRLSEGQKILNRGANANLNRFSGGTLKAAQQYQQDYASNEFGIAATRDENTFRANQDSRYSRLRDMTGIGESAVAGQNAAGSEFANRENLAGSQFGDRENLAGNEFGNRETANQVLTSQQIADLQIEKADAEASGNVEKSNALSQMISTGLSLAPTVLKALGIGGAAAGLIGGVPTTIGGAAAATAAANSAVAANTAAGIGTGGAAAGGGIGAAQVIPIVGAALAAGAMFVKSQAKWEANDAVKNYENPFAENSLKPFAAQWDQATASGQMTREAGAQARAAYYSNWEDYVKRITEWAGNSSDKKRVANQSINNLFNKMILPQMNRIDMAMGGLS